MKKNNLLKSNKAQTAVEYILLLTMVVALVLVGFKKYLPHFYKSSNYYYNVVGTGILGAPNRCGNGIPDVYETEENCPDDLLKEEAD